MSRIAPLIPAEPVPLLEVEDLHVVFGSGDRTVHAVNGISYSLEEGETLGVVGESGCGKSVSSLALMRLLPKPAARITSGRIMFQGDPILELSDEQVREMRGNRMAMIFQDPMTSLNPVLTVERQLTEVLETHRQLQKRGAIERAIELMDLVGIPAARRRLRDYPHQFSGGMRQRVMIAMALACDPQLLIADEPTTALDVTIQAQILDLMRSMFAEFGTALILITHDLALLAEHARRVAVMYAGEVVETQGLPALFERPHHPYTAALLAAIPERSRGAARLPALPGVVPALHDKPAGCLLSPRCPRVQPGCRGEHPPLLPMPGGGEARCLFPLHVEAAEVLQ